jgi:hypothetical protein
MTGDAAVAIDTAPSYREHAHRALRQRDIGLDDRRSTEVPKSEMAFWPTCRNPVSAAMEPLIRNCQRCGEEVLPVAGWWCEECDKVVWFLQQVRGMSMVQIAASGEYEPPLYEWVQDAAPWLLFKRIDTICELVHAPRKYKPGDAGELAKLEQKKQLRSYRINHSVRRSA